MSEMMKIIDTKKKKRSKSSESSESSDWSDSSLSSQSSSSSSSSSTSFDLLEYDSSSSVDMGVDTEELLDRLLKDFKASRKAAAARGATTFSNCTNQKCDKNGRLKTEGLVRLARVLKTPHILKMRNMERLLQRNLRRVDRIAYNLSRRHNIPESELGSYLTRKKGRMSADENRSA